MWVLDNNPAGWALYANNWLQRTFGPYGGNARDTYKQGREAAAKLVEIYLLEDNLVISPELEALTSDLESLEYDETAMEKGEDKIVKGNDHGFDALKNYIVSYHHELLNPHCERNCCTITGLAA